MKYLKIPFEFIRGFFCLGIAFVNYARGEGFQACNKIGDS